ncbi:asparagine synthase (glutamine-hydrolyzing) [Hahella sp. KA22]|uniref:asparagine synthase (glutamine-hydrolyzing) n=1 Tax=Hahella sp. KA22 TaxID=1628392 RepID=UPI000FDF0A5A|nr:asparagine synthase (glutamine-hydrolyzing) [Hahella sp. KA22]AZZ91664.1 asparagine synthase (glutamine-hydrolyzing) [Hahella sp. KA22]QAY55034.1 asparagine synthase (glutamine-hydrolyzing) [Hahella sp. KA22]
MCGITGFIHLDNSPASPVWLKRMTDAIAHRGPDGEGAWVENNVAIGHRRLAILDLSPAGRQPMISADHRFVLSYNGEIYNFRELRADLEAEGYWFRSNTDSEVVLNAIAAWGVEAITRFNGMFAFALWDRKEKRMLLARDRYGVKPLYYSFQNGIFYFGSEQKAITAANDYRRKIDKEGLLEYFTFQNFFTDRTLLQGMKMVPAGSYAWIDPSPSNAKLDFYSYWDFSFQEPAARSSFREYQEELDRLFRQAVNRQLVADVELGSYLSGGMDSGSIAALAAQNFNNLKTFTCGFDLSSASGIELGFDERAQAEAISALIKSEHYEMVLKAGDMERALPRMAHHLEEPRVGQSYPNFYVAQLASKFVKVVLSGVGGDELFGGYPWRYYRAASCNNFDQYIDNYYQFWHRLIPNKIIHKLFAPILDEVKNVWTRDIFRDVFKYKPNKLNTAEEYINHSLYFEAKTFMHGVLVVEDKLSMAHGLETRVPFLDNDLVDFAMRCPVDMKLSNINEIVRLNENEPGNKQLNYFQKTKDGKRILRESMRSYIPEEVTEAIKKGFSAPDASWFKGDSMEYVKRKLLSGRPHIYEFMDEKVLRELVEEHLQGKQNRRLLIWSLLNVEQWLSELYV